MTRKQNLAAALVTTASVALLAGAANAQNGTQGMGPGEARSGPAYCSTTVMSPAFNNCVMPAASAPGGGSFPGSFLVPGTNTSFAVHGIIWMDTYHWIGPEGAGYTTLQGPGASGSSLAAHAANGGFDMVLSPTRPNIETRTPTGYGEMKTYIEFDFNAPGASASGPGSGPLIGGADPQQAAGNQNLVRLRQSYGTLGPWLIGQTKELFDDVQAYPDIADAGLDAGMRVSQEVHVPQIRYTFLAGNGLTVATDIEMPGPAYDNWTYAPNGATALASVGGGATPGINTTTNGGYVNVPNVLAAAQWDQPWGHVRFAAMGGMEQDRANAAGAVSTFGSNPNAPGINHQTQQYAFHLSGHLNTWGKDALRGGIELFKGGGEYFSGLAQGNAVYNTTTGQVAIPQTYGIYASYEHFFTDQWRSNASFGYIRVTDSDPGLNNVTSRAGLVAMNMSTHLNVIFSPVPQTDFILEWERYQADQYSGANGVADKLTGQFKFYF